MACHHRPGPHLPDGVTGEDTDRILADFGFEEAERQALQAAGAVA